MGFRLAVRAIFLRAYRRFVGSDSDFAGGIAKLLLGATASRMIALAATPVLTRIYSPEAFGIAAVFISTVLVMLPISTMRLELAIPIARSSSDAVGVAGLALAVATLVCLALGLTNLFLWSTTGGYVFPSILGEYAVYLPLAILVCALLEVIQGFAIRQKSLRLIAYAQVFQTVAGTLAKLILGYLSPTGLSLLAGQVIQQAGGVLLLFRGFAESVSGSDRRWPSVSRMRASGRDYRDFPLVRMPSQLLQVLAAKLPVVLTGAFFGIASAGQFGLAFSMLALPVMLISQSAGNAYYAQIASLSNRDSIEIFNTTLRLIIWLSALAVLPGLLLMAYAEEMFAYIFGSEWAIAGRFCEAMSVFLFFQIVAGPLMHVFTVLRRSLSVFVIGAARLVVTVAAFALPIQVGSSAEATVWIFSFSMSFYYLAVVAYVVFVLKRNADNVRHV